MYYKIMFCLKKTKMKAVTNKLFETLGFSLITYRKELETIFKENKSIYLNCHSLLTMENKCFF